MDGAGRDLDGRFHSSVDIIGAVSASSPEPTVVAEPGVSRNPLLVKGAGDEDWKPLPS